MGYASQIASIAWYLPNEFYELCRGMFDLYDISVTSIFPARDYTSVASDRGVHFYIQCNVYINKELFC